MFVSGLAANLHSKYVMAKHHIISVTIFNAVCVACDVLDSINWSVFKVMFIVLALSLLRIKTFPLNVPSHTPNMLLNSNLMHSMMPLALLDLALLCWYHNEWTDCIYCYWLECRWFTGIVDFNRLTKRRIIRLPFTLAIHSFSRRWWLVFIKFTMQLLLYPTTDTQWRIKCFKYTLH